MKSRKLQLPPELQAFIKAGNTTLSCEDGDWDFHIMSGEKSAFHDDLPQHSVMLAENGCGDCLFLKASPQGKLSPKVFVFWHEEGRHEPFADHVEDLLKPVAQPSASAPPSGPKPTMPLSELEAALKSSEFRVRSNAIKKFAETDFGIDALPVLKQALANDWVEVVLAAAGCIGKLGPVAASVEGELILAGSKVWAYSGYANCYSACLDALLKVEADPDVIVEYVRDHVGLGCPDDLLDSLRALQAVGSPDALSILKRGAAFWLPELNLKYAREVKNILKAAKSKKSRS